MAPQMVRRPQPSGGGRYVLPTIVVLLIIGLMATIVELVLYFNPHVYATRTLNENIDKNLYEPLKAKGVELAKAPPSGDSRTPYRFDFFKQVGEVALLGTQYEQMGFITGYGPFADAVEEMTRVLREAKDVPQSPTTIKDYVTKLRAVVATDAITIKSLEEARDQALKERDKMRDLRNVAEKQVAEKVAEGDERLRKVRDEKEQENDQLKKANAELARELQTVRKDRNDLGQQLSKLREDSAKTIADLGEKIGLLDAQIAAKEPKRKKEVMGYVYQADMTRQFAIVGIGRRDDIKLGDSVEIYRVGKGGVKIKKATGKVVKVDEMISQADLFDLDKDHPVIEGDIVVPVKKN